jgi:(heptosyl)LPS beta-1,4-glucosyltransferase
MPPDLPISVLLLARDETRLLEQLLPGLAFAREVIVVWDTRGLAETRVAAERLGARVYPHDFAGFGSQRQFALERCTQPWVLWLDPDERLDRTACAGLRDVAAAEPREAAFTIGRRSYFLGRRIRFCGWQGERVLRVFRRERAHFDDARIHERVHVEGAVGRLPGVLEHLTYATWEECVRKLKDYAHAGAETALAAGRGANVLDVVLRPPLRFLRMFVFQLGILDGFRGFLVCALAAAQVFLKYAEVWAARRRGAARPGR